MNLGLQDRVVWITGASGGIGRALTEAFADEGALLALHGHANVAELRKWVAQQAWSERALVLEADVADAGALEDCGERILSTWGRIDVCAANAGQWPAGDLLLDELPLERLRRTIEVNLLGALYTARVFLGALRRTGPRPEEGASLTFTGSTAARFGERGHLDYATAKAGLIGSAQTLKNEIVQLDPLGRVNVVQPGWTVTHMARPALDQPGVVERVVQTMPLRQLGRAGDIARSVVWLSSPRAARHITGEVLTVAGGMEGRRLWGADEIDADAVRERARRP